MTYNINTQPSEQVLMECIQQNISLFAEGVTDFKKVRDFALQQVFTYLAQHGDASPLTNAQNAVNVSNCYARNNKVMQKKFLARDIKTF